MYQVDAFTKEPFKGNPAAVCVLETWPDDAVLQNIAAENNLAETAFIVKADPGYDLRWFTPEVEMDLCGHATLASAWVVFNFLQPELDSVSFRTMSGMLGVTRDDRQLLSMNFPSRPPEKTDFQDMELLLEALGKTPVGVQKSRDLFLVFEKEQDILDIKPDFSKLNKVRDCFAVIVTAQGDQVDFVSRFFAPNAGIPEDPVTGSAHCTLIPYWAERLGKKELHAKQLSARGGELFCKHLGDRVRISGYAALFLTGHIYL